MANENTNPTTYADWAKTRDPDGSTADIVEQLDKTNPIIEDAYVQMSNMDMGHRTTVRSGIPRGTWRKLNYGVMPSKTQSVQVTDTAGMLENYIEVDKSLADLHDDRAAFMLSEASGVMEGMNQDHVESLLYGDTTINPERFMGFMPRYNNASAESARNIVNGKPGGTPSTDDNSSIYIMTWGPQTMFEFFPKGSDVGLTLTEKGQVTLHDAAGGRYEGYRSHLKHDVGFCLRDWRFGVRIANLSTADILADGVDLIKALIKATHRLQNLRMGRTVIYANRDVIASLDIKANEKANLALAYSDWGAGPALNFRGMPIKLLEGISAAETRVTGLPTDLA